MVVSRYPIPNSLTPAFPSTNTRGRVHPAPGKFPVRPPRVLPQEVLMTSVTKPVRSVVWKMAAAALAGLLALGVLATPASAQGKASGTYLKEAFNRVTDNAALGGKIGGYGYIDGISVMAAWINQGGKATFTLTLDANVD